MKISWIVPGWIIANVFCIANGFTADQASYGRSEMLIEPVELARPEVSKQYVVLDVRDTKKYKQGHLPNALWLNHQEWAKEFGHGEDAEAWGKRIGGLGIGAETKVVVYDDIYAKDAARIWWILRYWGVENVRLLNGGWKAWEAGMYPTETTQREPTPVAFVAKARAGRLATKEQLLESIKSGKLQIIDARSESEFCGVEKLANKRGGSIPGAKQLEWIDLIDKKTHRFKSPADLRKLLEQTGIAIDKPTATYCQSGGRAAVMAFTMEVVGIERVSNYYPSWAEWSNAEDTPVIPGKAKEKKRP